MTITREQVADLLPGDVVRVDFGDGCHLEGPLRSGRTAELLLGPFLRLRRSDGDCALQPESALTVISRAPRPLYVNHPRTKPVAGDVVRKADGDGKWVAWFDGDGDWCARDQSVIDRSVMPKRLRLLVDGETGRVVP